MGGVGANLWMAVAQGLGFEVLTVRFNNAGYRHILSTTDAAPKILAGGHIVVVLLNCSSSSPTRSPC